MPPRSALVRHDDPWNEALSPRDPLRVRAELMEVATSTLRRIAETREAISQLDAALRAFDDLIFGRDLASSR